MIRGRTSRAVACRQDAHSVEKIADAAKEFFWLEREAKEAREDTGLKEVVIQTLGEDKKEEPWDSDVEDVYTGDIASVKGRRRVQRVPINPLSSLVRGMPPRRSLRQAGCRRRGGVPRVPINLPLEDKNRGIQTWGLRAGRGWC